MGWGRGKAEKESLLKAGHVTRSRTQRAMPWGLGLALGLDPESRALQKDDCGSRMGNKPEKDEVGSKTSQEMIAVILFTGRTWP